MSEFVLAAAVTIEKTACDSANTSHLSDICCMPGWQGGLIAIHYKIFRCLIDIRVFYEDFFALAERFY